jgi:hypothetical protein
MSKSKRNIRLIIGIVLILLTYRSVLNIYDIYFDSGLTRITFDIESQLEQEDIVNHIEDKTNYLANDIDVKILKEEVIIELPYMTMKEAEEIQLKMIGIFDSRINGRGITVSNPANPKDIDLIYQVVFLVYYVCFISGFMLVIITLKQWIIESKNANKQGSINR